MQNALMNLTKRDQGAPRSWVVYFFTRQYDAAIEEYLKAIETSPNFAHTHFLLGEAYVTKGRYKEGIAELQKAVALDDVAERWIDTQCWRMPTVYRVSVMRR